MTRRFKPKQPYGIKRIERLLIEKLPELTGERFACTSLGRAQLAAHLAEQSPESAVSCLFLDQYQARRAFEARQPLPDNLKIICDTDFPEAEFDAIVVILPAKGERELARDLMQDAFTRLAQGGRLFVGVETPKNLWLHEELKKLFPKVTQIEMDEATILSGVRKGDLKKQRDFSSEFAFRDGERLIKAISRPGVFSHRHLDLGARALIEAMQIAPNDSVLDIGCGSGTVSFAAAFRAPKGHVVAIDSHARAIQCTELGAELNGLTNITVNLDDEVASPAGMHFDVVLANPPYYSNYQIAEQFLDGAHRCLRPGGKIYLVAKKASWYLRAMPKLFQKVEVVYERQFQVVRGIQP
ncbi:MAG TPA: methyltransferase [Planctomycetaceae bacterium]|nr:methyltransferase [Planctomycetaceae bacterium]